MKANQKQEIRWARLYTAGLISGTEYAQGVAAMDLEKRKLAMDYLAGNITAEEFVKRNRELEAEREEAIEAFLNGEE